MEKAYALALQQILKKGQSPEKAVQALHAALQRAGRTALMPRIARAFARLAEQDRARNVITLAVARQKDADHALKAAQKHLAELEVTANDVVIKIDETLIGGWHLEGREAHVDASYKQHLLNIYSHATHA